MKEARLSVGIHLRDFRMSQTPENASGDKTKGKTCNNINNPGNTKQNVNTSLRFIMILRDKINYYCNDKQGFETADTAMLQTLQY
jgi:hypothetical protein